MTTVQNQYKVRHVKSDNKWGRSNRRHFARQNRRKKTYDGYEFEKKPRKLILSRFTGDGWMPCPSGYTRGQGWGLLHKAWIGYKRSLNPRNGESFQEKLRWAVTIQNIQTDLGLQRSAFPTLGIEGDYVFAYSISKQMELEDLDNELWLKEYKKKRTAHIQEIVNGSMLTDQEKEWLEAYTPQFTTDINRQVERIILPNLFDMRRHTTNTYLHSGIPDSDE
jgi:hypothetical protein